jgi:hypothetical protein
VQSPLSRLGRAFRRLAYDDLYTYSVADAAYELDVVLGRRATPTHVQARLFERLADREVNARLASALAPGVDSVLIEVTGRYQFRYKDMALSTLHMWRFVRAYDGALLPWYRRLCRGQAGPDDVDAALVSLVELGHDVDDELTDLLENIRFDPPSATELVRELAMLMSVLPARWTVVGPVIIADVAGDVMRDRRELRDQVMVAAEANGASFFDPSMLVEAFGTEAAMRDGGANLHHWRHEFYATVGEALNAVALGRDPAGVIGAAAV